MLIQVLMGSTLICLRNFGNDTRTDTFDNKLDWNSLSNCIKFSEKMR